MGSVIEPRYRSSYYIDLPEEREYAQRIVAAAEKLGLGNLVAAAKLARTTAWLVGLERRGSGPRAVAAAALYWIWLVEYLRGRIEPPTPQEAWVLVGSSRASFYRAIALWARHILRLRTHHPLLRLEARLAGTCISASTCARPGSHVAGIEPGGFVVLCTGPTSCRPPPGQAVELLLLPAHGNGRRRALNGYLKKRGVTYDMLRLREIIRQHFGVEEFTTHDFAAVTGLIPSSAGRLLYDLERYGIVERTGEARWKLRETIRAGRKSSRDDEEAGA